VEESPIGSRTIEEDDLPGVNRRLRLKSLYNVEFKSMKPPVARYVGDDLDLAAGGPAHLPASTHKAAIVLTTADRGRHGGR
jgi:hypothetical protein